MFENKVNDKTKITFGKYAGLQAAQILALDRLYCAYLVQLYHQKQREIAQILENGGEKSLHDKREVRKNLGYITKVEPFIKYLLWEKAFGERYANELLIKAKEEREEAEVEKHKKGFFPETIEDPELREMARRTRKLIEEANI